MGNYSFRFFLRLFKPLLEIFRMVFVTIFGFKRKNIAKNRPLLNLHPGLMPEVIEGFYFKTTNYRVNQGLYLIHL